MLTQLILILVVSLPLTLSMAIHHTNEARHPSTNMDNTMTIHILEVQPLVKADKNTIEHITADGHTVHEVVNVLPLDSDPKNSIIDEHEILVPLIPHSETKHEQKVHPIVNLIPNTEESKLAIGKDEPKKIVLTLSDNADEKKLGDTNIVKSREKKAYPIIQHVIYPNTIHTYYPVQDLRVIPLRRESYRSQVETYRDYEPNVFQTYYGGFGNGLNFGGHGSGHGFYAYG